MLNFDVAIMLFSAISTDPFVLIFFVCQEKKLHFVLDILYRMRYIIINDNGNSSLTSEEAQSRKDDGMESGSCEAKKIKRRI